ncbi:MAG: RNA polymerase sigma factor [Caldisericia bacterium]|jgi:RNA polymerase sigma-70 factor (ECF subfamily)|nr:RNA polymerase sigma factor [Caldisericia bacterium]
MTLERDEEIKLINLCKQGDDGAMAELFTFFKEELLRSAFLLLHSQDEAEDIVSNTFILFFKAIHRFDNRYPVRPWLHRILRNEINTFFKKRSRKQESDEEYKISVELFEPNHEEEVFCSEELKYLERALSELKEEERMLLQLYYYDELSVKDISETLSIPEGTVKSRLFSARNKLSEKIKKLMEAS